MTVGDPPLTISQKRAKKGMPSATDLRALAEVWLKTAHELYPDLVDSGVVASLDSKSIEQLVRAFARRFTTAELEPFESTLDRKKYAGVAAVYLRYSDDNSSPRSLDDQLVQAMRKAADEGRYVPWEFCFADASVTGRTHLRRGYLLVKEALERFCDTQLDTLYIEDFSRAARNAVETYRLAMHLERLRQRLIGVSDGFVLGTDAAQIQIMAAAMFNQLFIDQLRHKVLRGMKGAARRGTSLGLAIFGYKLVEQRDDNGRPVINSKEKPVKVLAIDQEQMQYVLMAARWFGEEHKSYKHIARQFSAMKVDGKSNWRGNHISKILACPLYIGVRIYNRTQTEWDKETGEFKIASNPRKDWIITKMPALKAWPDELWRKVRRRAAEIRRRSPRTGKKLDRQNLAMPECDINEAYPTTIVDGLLYCPHCDRPLRLVRSHGKYQQVGCVNGTEQVHNCTLRSSKSVRHVSTGLLEYVKEKLLTEEVITELVNQANTFLAEEAAKPKVDITPIETALTEATAQQKKLIEFVVANQSKHDMSAYLTRSDQLGERIGDLQEQLKAAKAANAAPPPPIKAEDVLARLDDLCRLFEQSVEKSAEVLKLLLGKVVVQEVAIKGRKRKAWIGHVNGDLVPLMAHASKVLDCPDRNTWEFLLHRIWTKRFTAEVMLEDRPAYVRNAGHHYHFLC